MKKSYILPFLAAGLLMTGCSKENNFGPTDGQGEGEFLKSALSMDIHADALTNTRAGVVADINEFKVVFTKDGNTEPYATYRYGDMPEVITLPSGSYAVTATYGENRPAEWENPYFLGKSETFEVTPYEITSYVDPILCELQNVMVTVDFDSALRLAMSPDSYVEVKVGNSGALNYGLAEADAKKAGFFKHSEEISLVAVFHGTIDGVETVETKSLSGVEKGYHYDVTFRLRNGGAGSGSGDIEPDINVDATVNIVDITTDVELGDEPLLDDDERPTEDGGGEDPEPVAPTITAQAPVTLGEDHPNNGDDMAANGTPCVLNIKSTAEGGITGFVCDIISDKLTPEELAGVGLSDHLDLVNPGDLLTPLTKLKLISEPVGGKKEVVFNLSGFLTLMQALGTSSHKFVLTVTDANGTTSETLVINFQ